MTILTDVPQSGVYFQQGAIVELVVQILDDNTGQPVQLQTATALLITLQYPNGEYEQFPANLYTDGSDGRIVYTTQNNGAIIDIDQTGLYQIQGNAIVNGIMLPQSGDSDFYVLPNIGPQKIYSAIVLTDITNVMWSIVPLPVTGTLDAEAITQIPDDAFVPDALVLRDADGVCWAITMVPVTGDILATVTTARPSLSSLLVQDAVGHIWMVTVLPSGDLKTR